MIPLVIDTERLKLVTMSRQFLELMLNGRKNEAAFEIGYEIATEWWAERELAKMRLQQILNEPEVEPWLLRAIIRKKDDVMVGHFNAHSAPGADYLKQYTARPAIEIGYTIYPAYRRLGYASECIIGFEKSVKASGRVEHLVISVHEENESSLLLARKLEFKPAGIAFDHGEKELVFVKEI